MTLLAILFSIFTIGFAVYFFFFTLWKIITFVDGDTNEIVLKTSDVIKLIKTKPGILGEVIAESFNDYRFTYNFIDRNNLGTSSARFSLSFMAHFVSHIYFFFYYLNKNKPRKDMRKDFMNELTNSGGDKDADK